LYFQLHYLPENTCFLLWKVPASQSLFLKREKILAPR
jgi:hypothetical protein